MLQKEKKKKKKSCKTGILSQRIITSEQATVTWRLRQVVKSFIEHFCITELWDPFKNITACASV